MSFPVLGDETSWWRMYTVDVWQGSGVDCERKFPVFDMTLYAHLRSELTSESPDQAFKRILRIIRQLLFLENLDLATACNLIDSLSVLIRDTPFDPPFTKN
jgi:hypothetical protein